MRIKLSIVLTLTTGRAFGDSFDEVHEAAEFVLGHPIWTHEFAERNLWDRLADACLRQYPTLPRRGDPSMDGIEGDGWSEYIHDQEKVFGTSLTLESMGGEREESPFESLARIAPGKPVIAVVCTPGG